MHGIIFLISIYVSVGYGGALTAILLNTPGSPQNAVTTLDGFELTKQGRAAEALGVSISSSVYGGLLSYFAMLASIGFVATVALKFGPAEMFLIAIAGVTVLGAVGSGSVAKTIGFRRLRPADRHDRHRADGRMARNLQRTLSGRRHADHSGADRHVRVLRTDADGVPRLCHRFHRSR